MFLQLQELVGLSTLLGIGMGIAVGQTGLVPFFWGAAVMTLGGMLFCLRLAVPARSDSISDNAA